MEVLVMGGFALGEQDTPPIVGMMQSKIRIYHLTTTLGN
jgi:hypothetical protein